jgi:predicted metalloprotease with PDZ domain
MKLRSFGLFALLFSLCFWIGTLSPLAAEGQNPTYRYQVDLKKSENGKLFVELLVGTLTEEKIQFCLPAIVPGTYKVYDFGRFVSDFQALDAEGKPLPFERTNTNTWEIAAAQKLHTIRYAVRETFSDERKPVVFEPAGTAYSGDLFVMNTHAIFGYFKNREREPLEIEIKKPADFYGSTSLIAKTQEKARDVFEIANYHELVDAPMMYCRPDTVNFEIGGAQILVSVYSSKGKIKAKDIADGIYQTLLAQQRYLNDELPIRKYAFLLNFFSGNSRSGSYGALEHSYSSFYHLPEMPVEYVLPSVIEIAAHEFFHILTPLNIHSEEIHYFDFAAPKMSKHLWLYEGVTEYFAHHALLCGGIHQLSDFLETMREKILSARQYKDTPFTVMSLGCLDVHEDEYGNVYDKGALIGLCLDLKLRILSEGQYGLINLMQDLSKRYGKEKPFKDEELFDVIAELTYPEIRTFLAKHVEDNQPLPLAELFEQVGILYQAEGETQNIFIGEISLAADATTRKLFLSEVNTEDGATKKIGWQADDVIETVNGKEVTAENLLEVLQNAKEGEILNWEVKRKVKGKDKIVKIKTPVVFNKQKVLHHFEPKDLTGKKLDLLRDWQRIGEYQQRYGK